MQDTIVNFETAKLAKERGFNIIQLMGSHHTFYKSDGSKIVGDSFAKQLMNYAPTQSLLQKWLREIHGIHIDFQYDLEPDMKTINVSFSVINHEGSLYNEKKKYLKYEEALEEGLQHALEILEALELIH
jgi:hypothetical protein